MRLVFIVLACLGLSACMEPTADDIARAKEALPAGCRVISVGRYGNVSNLYVVVCDGRKTVSVSWMSGGKSSTTRTAFTVLNQPLTKGNTTTMLTIIMSILVFALANPADNVELEYSTPFPTMEACEAAKPQVQELLNAFLTERGLDLTTVGTTLTCAPQE